MNLDDIEDEDDQECLLDYKQNEMNQATKKDEFDPINSNLFKIKESQDKGLADMETGSEVYMSELLVSIHNFIHLFSGRFRYGRL